MNETKLRERIARIIADDVCEHGEKCDATEWHGDTADKILALVRAEQPKGALWWREALEGLASSYEAQAQTATALCDDATATHYSGLAHGVRKAFEKLHLVEQRKEQAQEPDPVAEQAFLDSLSPGYRGLTDDGDDKTPYDAGWNDAVDAIAPRLRAYFRAQLAERQTLGQRTSFSWRTWKPSRPHRKFTPAGQQDVSEPCVCDWGTDHGDDTPHLPTPDDAH